MRKLALLVALIMLLAGCANTEKHTETAQQESDPVNAVTSQSTEDCYEITYKDFQYTYRIFDADRNLVEEYTSPREPTVLSVNGDIIRLTIQAGTGLSTQWGFFYDSQKNLRSENFDWIYDQTDSLVVQGGLEKLIVRSIFDDTYYKELTEFQYPLSEATEPFLSAEISQDGTYVTVSYLTGEDYEQVTEKIWL